MILHGLLVTLRPALPSDRRAVWEWAAQSDLTASMMGPPDFPENPAPTWDEFCSDYLPYFFDGSMPECGRSFIIEHHGESVGHISYSRGDERPNFAELDIWMRNSSHCSHGWGSEALLLLSNRLQAAHGVRKMILRPSARNLRAIHSYEKAGFKRVVMDEQSQTSLYGRGEYHDTVVMRLDQCC